ncbi:retrovirus-related pol polyprotein from transposon TNT 1-94, partial [Tanacetum coccineum]
MSTTNNNNNMQTQTSSALHNAIMEARGKDRPPMLAPGNYVQWKSRLLRYIDTKPNKDLIHHCLANPPYKFKWVEKTVPVAEGIDNDICSTVDACPNAMEMWKAIERFYKMMNELVRNQCDVTNHQVNVQFLLQLQPEWQRSQQAATRNRGKAIVNYPPPTYNPEPATVAEDDEMSKQKDIDKIMALISLSLKKIYKPTNNNLRTSSNTSRANHDNSPRTSRGTRDDSNDEPDDQELEAHYMYMEKIQEVSSDAAANSRPIFDVEPLQKVQYDNDNYNLFANDKQHPKQPESINDTYIDEQDNTNIIIDSLDMSYNREKADQDDEDDSLAQERDLLASLIEKLKCEIDDIKNQNKLLESSNKILVDKLKSEIEDFKNKNKSLESSNTHFKEANSELSKTNQLMFKDLKKFQAELDRYHDINYASKVEIDCAKAKRDLMSYKMESQKSFNEYTRKINDLNQMISEMQKELIAHQETISIMSQQNEAQKQFHKTRKDNELEKVIALENKIKVLDDIVYKIGQSVQTMNTLNHNCKTSFVKLEFLKKAQRANPRLYDTGCYNDNLALMLAPESDKTIRLAQEIRSKLSVECCKEVITRKIGHGFINLMISSTIETNLDPQIHKLMHNTDTFLQTLKEEMVDDLRYFNSLEQEVDSLKSQLETQKTQFLNEIDRLSREYYYADHMNAILGVYTKLDEVTNLQCDYLEALEKFQSFENELSIRNTTSKSFEALQQHAINLKLALQQYLKAQLQDKGIAISELKKLIEKMKGKYVETKFEKPSVIQQPNAFKSQRQSILEIILFIVNFGCSKHMTGNLKLLSNFVEKFPGTVKFGNDQITPIIGYRDQVQGNIIIKRVYYVQGLNHNLFSVGQFCKADLEVAFRKSACYVRDLKGNDLLTAWLWHRRLSHLNFDSINLLSKNDIVIGLPKLKFVKDHLCSSCELGKAKQKSFHTMTTPSSKRRLQLLHMDLCGPMRVESINGKKYVLVIVDDYSKYTWTHFLRSKDETPEVLIDFLKLVQRGLYAQVRTIRTDKGTKFLNKTRHAYFAQEGTEHQTSVARTPEQNGVVERRNRTLVEAARTMLSA